MQTSNALVCSSGLKLLKAQVMVNDMLVLHQVTCVFNNLANFKSVQQLPSPSLALANSRLSIQASTYLCDASNTVWCEHLLHKRNPSIVDKDVQSGVLAVDGISKNVNGLRLQQVECGTNIHLDRKKGCRKRTEVAAQSGMIAVVTGLNSVYVPLPPLKAQSTGSKVGPNVP